MEEDNNFEEETPVNVNGEYDIYAFLDDHRVDTGQSYTHLSMGTGKMQGKFFVRNNEIDMFYELYEKAFFANELLYLVEKHEEIGPIVIDFDFNYEFDTHERMHTFEHVEKIVELYINEIVDLYKIERTDERLTAFVFEREKPYKSKGIAKDGIHIMFPNIVTPPEHQYYIRKNVLKKIAPIIADLPVKNGNDDIIDKSVIYSNGWMMFGSRKPKCEMYLIKYIFNGQMENIAISNYPFGTLDLPRFFSIRGKKHSELIELNEGKKDLIEKEVQKKKITTNLKLKSGMNVNYDVQQIGEIVNILSNERANNYTQWIEVGWSLHNIDPNSQELLDMWINFSKRSSKFVDGECEKEWEKMRGDGLNIGSLYYWAKIDNNEEYNRIMDRDINRVLTKSIDQVTNYDIAEVLYKIYRYEFKYSNSEWFMFKNHLWHTMKDAMELRQKISTELVKKYMKLIGELNRISSSDNADITEEEKEEAKKKSKKVMDLINKLKTTSFKESLMKECKELFYDKDFFNKLDTNPFLIGFNNGIYDLQKMELRDGRPDDYVCITTDIDKIEFTKEHEYWDGLCYFLSTVFVDPTIKNYFLTYLATNLQGVNNEEKFRIWTGVGGNGKSKIIELFVYAFGPYTNKLPVTLLTGKRAQSNACTPEILQSKGKRFCYMEEPDEKEKINVGLMKEFTGGDKIKARGLNKDPIEFKPQFKLALLCNDVPEVPPNDTGTWRRMEVIEFKSRFVKTPREPNEFEIDEHLSEKLPLWRELFMALLIDVYYENYKKYGLIVPDEVKKYTLEYQKQCDNYIEFIMEAIEDTKVKEDIMSVNEMHDEFKLWYMEENNDHKAPARKEFKAYLIKKFTKDRFINSKEMKGFKFKEGYQKRSEGKLTTVSAPPAAATDGMGSVIGHI